MASSELRVSGAELRFHFAELRWPTAVGKCFATEPKCDSSDARVALDESKSHQVTARVTLS